MKAKLIDADAFLEDVLPECKYPDELRKAVERQPTIPDIDRADILRLCNEIEGIATDIKCNTRDDLVYAYARMVFDKLKAIENELTIESRRTGYWYFENKDALSRGACKCSECKISITCRGQIPGPDNLYCRHCGSKNSDDSGNMIFRDQED